MKNNKNVVVKKGCHCRGMLSAISRIRLRKQAVNCYLKTTKQEEDSQQKLLGMTSCFITAHGFTLIELLVVVLIIGILATIALPQYQKAVEKSRLSEALLNISIIEKQMDLYILEHGKPNTYILYRDFATVDIPGEINGNRIVTKNFQYYVAIGPSGKQIEVYHTRGLYSFYIEEGIRACYTEETNIGKYICKNIEPTGWTFSDASL